VLGGLGLIYAFATVHICRGWNQIMSQGFRNMASEI